MVAVVGFEPTRTTVQQIFLLLYVTIADEFRRCSLDYVLTMPYGLGCWYIVSTHLFGAVFSSICIS